MGDKIGTLVIVFILAILVVTGSLAFYFAPWKKGSWGNIGLQNQETITVIGSASSQEKTQIGTFNVGVNATLDSKEQAIQEVDKKVNDIIAAVKNFGISSADIKTQSINVNQNQETYYEEGRQKTRPGQWQVGNSIIVTLRDINRASALSSLLTSSGATNVYGPNFSLGENPGEAEQALLAQALENAQSKAQALVTSSGKKIGKILSITESATSPNYIPYGAGGGGGGMEPGTQSLSKQVTVTFEIAD